MSRYRGSTVYSPSSIIIRTCLSCVVHFSCALFALCVVMEIGLLLVWEAGEQLDCQNGNNDHLPADAVIRAGGPIRARRRERSCSHPSSSVRTHTQLDARPLRSYVSVTCSLLADVGSELQVSADRGYRPWCAWEREGRNVW